MDLGESVKNLNGIGVKKAAALEKMGIRTIEDLVFFFPRNYEDRRKTENIADLAEGPAVMIRARVDVILKDRYRYGGKQRLRILVTDDTASLEVVFFNAVYLADKFATGEEYIFFGKVTYTNGKKQMLHPQFGKEGEFRTGILPVYPLTKGISQKEMRKWQESVIGLYGDVAEVLPEERISENNLCSIGYALANVHFPEEKQKLQEARYRLIFDECLTLQTGLMKVKRDMRSGRDGIAFSSEIRAAGYTDTLPYELTSAQKRCIEQIEGDLESPKVMNRLVQGDVGSGKTAVAEAAMYKAAACGYQSVMMAPTEILARQHFEGIRKNFERHGISCGFLSGSLSAGERRRVLEDLEEGKIQILVGTHAVIQPGVTFANLGLVITDEQHRFGVGQRIQLRNKGRNPNILVMTATPIPRTLAVVLYGDMDVSVIDELPPGRQKISTRALGESDRRRCYDFVERELTSGRQAYVVAPLIEDSEEIDARSLNRIFSELKERFPERSVEVLHGAMKQEEKDAVMERFYEGKIDILAATVVIEVGINVPNATVMVIEDAERFGLAQLHQLRGRVGRGSHRSYCFLITRGGSETAKRRAEIMERSSDGFYIAEMDLELRGPGEIFGTRQHGLPDLALTDMARHMDILRHAGDEAKRILDEDPMLEDTGHTELKKRIERFFGRDPGLDL